MEPPVPSLKRPNSCRESRAGGGGTEKGWSACWSVGRLAAQHHSSSSGSYAAPACGPHTSHTASHPAAPQAQSKAHLLAEVPADGAHVHEVAVAAAGAAVLLVLPAGGLPEVCNRGELHGNGLAGVVAPLEALQRAGRLVLVPAGQRRRVVGSGRETGTGESVLGWRQECGAARQAGAALLAHDRQAAHTPLPCCSRVLLPSPPCPAHPTAHLNLT